MEWEGWIAMGGQEEEGTWAVKWEEDEKYLGSTWKYLKVLKSTWAIIWEEADKYLGNA